MRVPVVVAVLGWMLVGCQKEAPAAAPPKRPPAPAAPAAKPPAEVEMNIQVQNDVADAARTVVFVSPQPCDSDGAAQTKYGAVPAQVGRPTFIEVFVPQGSKGYVCAVALDAAGKLVGLGSADQNPLNLAGDGEVQFRPVVHVVKLAAARAAPAGL